MFAAVVLLPLVLLQPAERIVDPDKPVFNLDEVGLYRVGYAFRGRPETDMPYGWLGHFEDTTGVSCTPFGTRNGRPSFLLHCPWRNGTGIVFQEFTIRLPSVRRIVLRGATAMMADIVEKSDGAVFRILLNGQPLYEVSQKDAEWRPFEVDLTRYKGQTVRLRFETDPGPADNPAFDYSLWSNRELHLEGFRPPQKPPRPRPSLDLRRVSSRNAKTPAPGSGWPGTHSVTLNGSTVTFRYTAADGTFEYIWEPRQPHLGRFSLRYTPPGGQPVAVPVGAANRILWTGEAGELTTSEPKRLPDSDRVVVEKVVQVGTVEAKLTLAARLVGKSLALTARCDQPVVSALDAGDWRPVLRRRQVPVPYYGSVLYLVSEDLFAHTFLDWTASLASRHDQTTAVYDPLTDGRRNLLDETIYYAAARHLLEVLPSIPNPPSPYLGQMGEYVVLDVWGGRYEDIARKLEVLHSYGLRKCLVLVHDWQRSGYDNALPMHIPAAADKGGDEGMKVLVGTATRLGYWIALHENYVDYYPNYDHFDERHIALDSQGKRVLAWYNASTRIQSFAIQPNAILPLAQTQSPEIHARYGTNACYLDVHSAVPPWFHVDFRATEPGAGTFRQVWQAHRDLWAYEREVHKGPVLGEGNAHWYWSGLLDGVEAQFGTGWPTNEGQNAPLMVDFNLLKIHPLQLNHGQGYYERWWKNMPWGAVPTMSHLDRYRLQEVLYGHIGFLGASAWDKVPYAWLEYHLLTPVTARHAAVPVKSIEYFVDGRWMDPTEAAIQQNWQRAKVEFENGLVIIGNASSEVWRIHGATLPENGWLARGAGVTAYTAVRDGVVVDYAETEKSVFANARPSQDWDISGVVAVRPSVAQFAQTGPRQFSVTYEWRVRSAIRDDYTCFVHFSTPERSEYEEGIRFQQDHALPTPTSTWRPGTTGKDGPFAVSIPADIPDGRYEWSIGLFIPGRHRALIEGPRDRSGRIVLGTLVVANGGQSVRFEPNDQQDTPLTLPPEPLNVSDTVVTFANVKTNGSVAITREGNEWVLRAMPRTRPFHVELNSAKFGKPSAVRAVAGSTEETISIAPADWWRLPLNGAHEYRWPAR